MSFRRNKLSRTVESAKFDFAQLFLVLRPTFGPLEFRRMLGEKVGELFAESRAQEEEISRFVDSQQPTLGLTTRCTSRIRRRALANMQRKPRHLRLLCLPLDSSINQNLQVEIWSPQISAQLSLQSTRRGFASAQSSKTERRRIAQLFNQRRFGNSRTAESCSQLRRHLNLLQSDFVSL